MQTKDGLYWLACYKWTEIATATVKRPAGILGLLPHPSHTAIVSTGAVLIEVFCIHTTLKLGLLIMSKHLEFKFQGNEVYIQHT